MTLTTFVGGAAVLERSLKQAVALHKGGALIEAEHAYERLAPAFPSEARIPNNWGVTLTRRGRVDEALAKFREAIALKPDYVDALSNVAGCFWAQQRYDEAEAAFVRGLKAVPDSALLRQGLGILRLHTGRFELGWPDYEARLSIGKLAQAHKSIPRWDGRSALSGPLFVWAEQGLGDEVLQLSMLGDVLRMPGIPEVWWGCDERLGRLIARSFPTVKLYARWRDGVLGAAAQIPAASLGRIVRNDLSRFPDDRFSYLVGDQTRARDFRRRIGASSGPIIGISWLSSGSSFSASKSAALKDLAALAKIPGATLVDLQYGDTEIERDVAAAAYGMNVVHFDDLDLRDDLDGLGALIQACDSVVTISNVTAHLAGALGRPTTVLVSAGTGHLWYWGHEGETIPWYPLTSLARQAPGEAWTSVVARVCECLT